MERRCFSGGEGWQADAGWKRLCEFVGQDHAASDVIWTQGERHWEGVGVYRVP